MAAVSEERNLSGIGGWLLLLLLGLIISPIRMSLHLFQNYAPLLSDDTWQELTTPTSEAYHPLWAPLITFEIIGNIIVLFLGLVTLYVFMRKSKYTSRIAISWLLASFLFVVSDYFLADLIPFIADLPNDPETLKEIARSTIGAAVWIPYFLVSKRVKATFTR